MELIELPHGIIATGSKRMGMSSEKGDNVVAVPRPELSGELKTRTEVFEKIPCITWAQFVQFCLMLSVILCYKVGKYFLYLRKNDG